jgi:hypothetical protein
MKPTARRLTGTKDRKRGTCGVAHPPLARNRTESYRIGPIRGNFLMARRLLSEGQARFVGNVLEQAKLARDLSNEAIADRAGYNEKTIRDVLKGHCLIYKTTSEVARALDFSLDEILQQAGLSEEADGSAPAHLGGYSRSNYTHLLGGYTTVRPVYGDTSYLRCYRTLLDWDVGASCLHFTEAHRPDGECQTGHVYIPPASTFMYFLTVNKGWVRTVLVSQPIHTSILRGLILSQFNVSGANFAPVCSPIAYIKEQSNTNPGDGTYGELGPGDPQYERYAALIREIVSKTFVKVALLGDHVQAASPQ